MNEANGPDASTILIVDDQPAGIHALANLLRSSYRILVATDGPTALEIAVRVPPPDLILLDVEMPAMDGYEVCRRLKALPATRQIPLFFVTARDGTDDEEVGLQLGAADYISKPFQPSIVRARIRNHLQLHRQQLQIQQQNRQIQSALENLRELEILRDSLVGMIVHDLRSPLTGILGYAEFLESDLLENGQPQMAEHAAQICASAKSLQHMITTLLDISRMEARQMPLNPAATDLRSVVAAALSSLGGLLREAQVVPELPDSPALAHCDPDATRRIIENLVANAIKFSGKSGEIRIRLERRDADLKIVVQDHGAGIPPEYHTKIFEKFGQVSTRIEGKKFSTGLGLTFCKLAAEAQGGQIGLDSHVGQGSSFWFTLPPAP